MWTKMQSYIISEKENWCDKLQVDFQLLEHSLETLKTIWIKQKKNNVHSHLSQTGVLLLSKLQNFS